MAISTFKFRLILRAVVIVGLILYIRDCVSMPSVDKYVSINKRHLDGLSQNLSRTVVHLTEAIGHRNVLQLENLRAAENFIEKQFIDIGFAPSREAFEVVKPGGYEVRDSPKSVVLNIGYRLS